MPFDLVAGLGCTGQLNFFDGQLVLKGFSSMFVPLSPKTHRLRGISLRVQVERGSRGTVLSIKRSGRLACM